MNQRNRNFNAPCLLVVLGATLLSLTACGGHTTVIPDPPPTPTITSVTVTCPAAGCTVATGQQLQMTKKVNGTGGTVSQTVTWSIATAGSYIGTIDTNGLYVASDFEPSGGSVVIKALASDGKTSGTATITVTQGTIPTRIAYANQGCPGCNSYITRIWSFKEGDPTDQVAVSKDGVASSDNYPVISPDKKTAAFVRYAPTSSLYVAPIEGGGTPTLVKDWPDTHFDPLMIDWNPSGTGFVVAYMDTTREVCGLETVSREGTTINSFVATEISCPAGGSVSNSPNSPKYLSDGSIVYTSGLQVFVLSADGMTKVAIPNVVAWSVALSPDGKKIVFDGPSGISTADIDGSNILPLTTVGTFPAWCPDNTIVYDALNGNDGNIYTVKADGTSNAPVQVTTWASFYPSCR